MNIIDFEGAKEQKECIERADQLRALIRNADLSWMDNPTDFRTSLEITLEEKVAAQKRYAEDLKEYRKEFQQFNFAKARYEQGLDEEEPLFPPLPPIIPGELIPSLDYDEEVLEASTQKINEWWDEINRPID